MYINKPNYVFTLDVQGFVCIYCYNTRQVFGDFISENKRRSLDRNGISQLTEPQWVVYLVGYNVMSLPYLQDRSGNYPEQIDIFIKAKHEVTSFLYFFKQPNYKFNLCYSSIISLVFSKIPSNSGQKILFVLTHRT